MIKVLIVEDEEIILQGLIDNLEIEGYDVITARDGTKALELAKTKNPDLIILDIMLPKKSGYDVCKELRMEKIKTPILMLTAKGQEVDKVLGLELGADDYVTKPFSVKELLARIKAVLRRYNPEETELKEYKFGKIKIDFAAYKAFKGNRELDLSAKEFDVLRLLISNKGKIVSRDDFLEKAWGYDEFPTTRTVDNHIASLRQKIEDNPSDPKYIITVHGVGYRFEE